MADGAVLRLLTAMRQIQPPYAAHQHPKLIKACIEPSRCRSALSVTAGKHTTAMGGDLH